MGRNAKIGRGIYKRGNIYWLAIQKNGQREFITLETADPAEAVRRTQVIRENLTLEASSSVVTEIRRFVAYKVRQQEYTRSSEVTKRNKLLLSPDRFLRTHLLRR